MVMDWSRPAAPYGQVAALVRHSGGLPRDHNWSRGELEAVPSGDPPNDLPHRQSQALGHRPAVDDDGETA